MSGKRLQQLAREAEQTFYNYSPAWSGYDVRRVDMGDALLHIQPFVSIVSRICIHSDDVEMRIDEIIQQVAKLSPHCSWILGPSSQPADLENRLVTRKFVYSHEWEGLILDDVSQQIESNPKVFIEPLSWANMHDYAQAIAGNQNSSLLVRFLAQAERFLQLSPQQVRIDVAKLDGVVAGYALLRIEKNGIAYLRSAMTVPAFRNRGVYLSLVAYRLSIARSLGCTAAVIQAETTSSAPILKRHGFKTVCRLISLDQNKEMMNSGQMKLKNGFRGGSVGDGSPE